MRKILFIISMLASTFAFSQQDAMFTHYMYNTLAVNPAYAGSRDALTVTGLYRNQWAGFKDAPVAQTITVHTPIFAGLGLGASFVNDQIGPIKNSSYYLDISYRLKFEKSYLSFGLKGGINSNKLDLVSLYTQTPNDPLLTGDNQKDVKPNFGAGVYYHTDKYYLGFSVPKLLENSDSEEDAVNALRHYFFIAGAVFDINENIQLKPTTFVKVVPSAPIELDATATFILFKTFNVGAMYRTGDAFGLLAGLNLTKQLTLGYSFDWSMTNKTGTYNNGSHEIMLRYDFFFISPKKIKSPRNF
jgi:type IX secretion system PorP/SprF family membrane protein